MKKVIIILQTLIFFWCLRSSAAVFADAPELYKNQGTAMAEILAPSGWQEEEFLKPSPSTFSGESYLRGYAVYERNYMDLKNPNFSKDDLKTMKLSMAAGEYEPIVFAIFAVEDLNGLKIDSSDLVDAKGNLINKANIDIRSVTDVPTKRGKKQVFTLEPILLERFNSLYIKKNGYKIFWLTIFIPLDTPPGDYAGEIYIKPSNKAESFVELKINVLPFVLQKPPVNFGIYYDIDSRWKGFYPQSFKRDLIDIREHGLTTLTIYFAPKINFENEVLDIDFSKGAYCSPFGFDEFMTEYVKAGFNAPSPFLGVWYPLMGELENTTGFSLYSEEFDNYYAEALKLIEERRIKMGWPEFLYSPEDEPANNEKKMQKVKHYLALIKKTLPHNRTYLTLNGLRLALNEGKELDPWLDVRCYAFFNKTLIDETVNAGDELWIYNGGSETKDKALLDRYFYGFFAMKTRAKGVMQWVYQWPISHNSIPSNELFEQGEQGWYYTYPSCDGPVPTQYWEALREGIDDAKYIYTLRQFISRAKNSGNNEIAKEAVIAGNRLNDIMSRLDIYHHIPEESESARRIFGGDLSAEKAKIMDRWRNQIKEEIVKLYDLLENAKE